jgi:hypothetical protein
LFFKIEKHKDKPRHTLFSKIPLPTLLKKYIYYNHFGIIFRSHPISKSERGFSQFTSSMKMMKAVNKLKFWSRKKRKKKTQEPYYPPPPPCHCCHSCYSTQPSAPPLPPWLDLEQTHQAIPAPVLQPFPDLSYPNQTRVPIHEIVSETSPIMYPTLPATASTPSYQQYMAPNPVYGIPVGQTARRERTAGIFGCVINFGIHLFRCFCPCFHIREVANAA